MVFINAADITVAQTIAVGRFIAEAFYFLSVVPVKAISGAKPQKAAAVLRDRFNGTIAQALFIGKVFEPEFRSLGSNRRRNHVNYDNNDGKLYYAEHN